MRATVINCVPISGLLPQPDIETPAPRDQRSMFGRFQLAEQGRLDVMENPVRRLIYLLLLVVITSAATAFGADNSTGTWKVNLEKTKYIPAPFPVKNITQVREAAPGGVKVTNTGERSDGTPINATYTAKYDGSPTSVSGQGSPYDTVSIKQVDANTFTWDAKKTGGKYHSHGRIVVSPDGKTMTLTSKGTNSDGVPMSVTLVFDKQ